MENPESDQTSSSTSSSPPKFIPFEIMIDIITRLPSKSLVRFGAVSKSWYSFIRTPNFITTHLNRSSLPSNSRFLLTPANFKYNGDNVCSILDKTTLIEHSNFKIPWKSNHRWIFKFGHVICYCDGVICFGNHPRALNQLFLCNPSLRKLKFLPPSCYAVAVFDKYESVFGFGVDRVSGDYKVVRIFYNASNWEVWPLVEVYSLRSDSWKKVELSFNIPRAVNLHFSSVFCNGCIHWFADTDINKPKVILCFDLSDEVFHEMELPVGLAVMKRGYVFLFKESLSLFVEIANENSNEGLRYEVWIMKEYGVVESWTKEFKGVVEGVRKSEVGFSKSGKVILRKKDGMLAILDLECGQVEDVGFHEKYYRVADYVESLVLLEDGVSSRAQAESVSHQTGGGPRSSSRSCAVEDNDANRKSAMSSSVSSAPTSGDANWRAAISSAVSPLTNAIPTQMWGDWGTS